MASYDVVRNICQALTSGDLNNTNFSLSQGTFLHNSRPLAYPNSTYPNGSSPISGGGIVVQAVQTAAGKYSVQVGGCRLTLSNPC